MSLLLDALKRAEQEKSARESTTPPPAAPPPRSAPAGVASLELQPIGGPSTAGIPAQRAGDAHGAQTMFEAKQAGKRAQDARGKGPLLAAIGAIAVIVLAAGAYVWFSIQSLAPRAPMAGGPGRPSQIPAPPPASSAPSPAPSLPATAPAPAATVATVAAPPAQAAAPAETRDPATAEAAQKRAMDLLRQPAPRAPAGAPPAEPPVQLARTVERPVVPANVAGGYDALRRGDLAEARGRYETALAAEPSSIDANLGLATVEARSGRATAAAALYRKALQLDPSNATALAGMAALSDFSRPDELEMRLKADITRYPQSAPLHATLGNLYASQKRWTEAQTEYFEAHRLQPSSADTLYNLAVSLDHLGQTRLAREYYARALDAARGQATQFDSDRVSRRLAEIQR